MNQSYRLSLLKTSGPGQLSRPCGSAWVIHSAFRAHFLSKHPAPGRSGLDSEPDKSPALRGHHSNGEHLTFRGHLTYKNCHITITL